MKKAFLLISLMLVLLWMLPVNASTQMFQDLVLTHSLKIGTHKPYNHFSVDAATGKMSFSSTAGIIHGAGTSTTPHSIGATGGKAMSYYISTTSATTTHALEGLYVRTYYGTSATAAAPMGEAIRAYASIVGDAAGGTITGMHSSVNLVTTGATNTGLTLGSRSNLILPDGIVASTGTYAGAQVEINTGGAASSLAGVTASLLRLVIAGTAPTAPAQMRVPIFDLNIPANCIGTDATICIIDSDATTATPTAKMLIRVNGTEYWMYLDTAAD